MGRGHGWNRLPDEMRLEIRRRTRPRAVTAISTQRYWTSLRVLAGLA
jgi:hypothetical protein